MWMHSHTSLVLRSKREKGSGTIQAVLGCVDLSVLVGDPGLYQSDCILFCYIFACIVFCYRRDESECVNVLFLSTSITTSQVIGTSIKPLTRVSFVLAVCHLDFSSSCPTDASWQPELLTLPPPHCRLLSTCIAEVRCVVCNRKKIHLCRPHSSVAN